MAGRVPTHIMLGVIVFLITLASPGHSSTTKSKYYLEGPWKHFDIKAANDFCKRDGGYLTEINNEEEFGIIREFIMKENNGEPVFIGGNDIGRDGVWKWYNSKKNAMKILPWAKGQPDDAGGVEHCMVVAPWLDHKLNDYPCTSAGKFLCEVPYKE